jgi:tetratricopeptide (TPR) repeat protein
MTMTGDILGTLRYMSPEQALAKRVVVDHRSDIYSLGVTLYELFTLAQAYQGDDRQELLRQIAFEDPPRPRHVNPRIPSDMETVVLKAIAKELADRYSTAQELANDLRRFLDNRPIVARAPSIVHQARKWAGRHVELLAAAAAVLLILAVGAGMAALLIARERSVAEQNAQQASANAQLALKTLDETLSEYVMGDLARDSLGEKEKELLRRGMAFFEQYARQNDVTLTSILTYQRLVSTYLLDEAMALEASGHQDEADQAYRKAIRHAERVVALHEPTSTQDARWLQDGRYALAVRHENYGVFLSHVGQLVRSAAELMQARATFAEFHEREPQVANYAYRLGVNHYNMGTIETAAGDTASAENSYRAAIPLLQQALRAKPEDGNFRFVLARAQYNLAHLLGSSDRMEPAQQHWEVSLSEWRRLAEINPYVSEYPSRVGASLHNLGELARQRGDLAAARRMLEEALVHQKRALHLEPIYHEACEFINQHYETLKRVLQEQRDDVALKALGKDRAAVLTQSKDNSSSAAQFAGDPLNSDAERQVDHSESTPAQPP